VNEGEKKNRDFDWGPPANSLLDRLKEVAIYILLFVLLGAGTWFLLDISASSQHKVKAIKKVLSPEKSKNNKNNTPDSESLKPEKKLIEGKYFVQLGAFAEKDSALTAFEAVKQQGYEPELAEPDSDFEIYRVSIGPFASELEAEKVALKLNSLEIHCFVISSL
jgi:cell division protein FtsN